jgi:hypothetical protein
VVCIADFPLCYAVAILVRRRHKPSGHDAEQCVAIPNPTTSSLGAKEPPHPLLLKVFGADTSVGALARAQKKPERFFGNHSGCIAVPDQHPWWPGSCCAVIFRCTSRKHKKS